MTTPDFNLLITLDALLTELSVARAAKRLRLSPSAMSRALARLRETTGDPLLVRAGRGLVATPRALELREKVSQLVADAETALRPMQAPDLKKISRTFTLRTREGFVENFGPALLTRIASEAPKIHLCFLQKIDKDSASLRDGTVNLETGVVDESTSPELRTRILFEDRFIGVANKHHPLNREDVTVKAYADAKHIQISRRGNTKSAIDETLHSLGLQRNMSTTVGSFSTALSLVRDADLIATVPERHTESLRRGLASFDLPFPAPQITVSMIWHPRMDADPVHRWLRNLLLEICSATSSAQSAD
ncbi:MAG: LysR family transcriptional regulator [Gammaproteobacteria bacterium]|nr:MAG: LysR family transcriptional regulator [Gammaproteobacteria bacterium]